MAKPDGQHKLPGRSETMQGFVPILEGLHFAISALSTGTHVPSSAGYAPELAPKKPKDGWEEQLLFTASDRMTPHPSGMHARSERS